MVWVPRGRRVRSGKRECLILGRGRGVCGISCLFFLLLHRFGVYVLLVVRLVGWVEVDDHVKFTAHDTHSLGTFWFADAENYPTCDLGK
jgi:hypothetical protein